MNEQFAKKGRESKRSKKHLGIKNERKRMGEPCDFANSPDPLDRRYANRYRKSALGKQQYPGDEEEGMLY